jgi:hypothetical protein
MNTYTYIHVGRRNVCRVIQWLPTLDIHACMYMRLCADTHATHPMINQQEIARPAQQSPHMSAWIRVQTHLCVHIHSRYVINMRTCKRPTCNTGHYKITPMLIPGYMHTQNTDRHADGQTDSNTQHTHTHTHTQTDGRIGMQAYVGMHAWSDACMWYL